MIKSQKMLEEEDLYNEEILKYMIICIVLLFMYIPILVLAVYSFTDAANIGAIHAFSMHNYVTLYDSGAY